MTKPVTPSQLFLARVVLVLIVAFTIAGLLLYGISAEERARLWYNLVGRQDGPLLFRYFLQPLMGASAAPASTRRWSPHRASSCSDW